MKSRIIALAMALVCLLGVAGCGKSSDNSDSGKTSEKSSDKKGSSGGAEEVVKYSMVAVETVQELWCLLIRGMHTT